MGNEVRSLDGLLVGGSVAASVGTGVGFTEMDDSVGLELGEVVGLGVGLNVVGATVVGAEVSIAGAQASTILQVYPMPK